MKSSSTTCGGNQGRPATAHTTYVKSCIAVSYLSCINHVCSFCKLYTLTSALHTYTRHSLFCITQYACHLVLSPYLLHHPTFSTEGPYLCRYTFQKQIQSPHLQPPLLLSSHTMGHYLSALVTPMARNQAIRNSPFAGKSIKIIQTS